MAFLGVAFGGSAAGAGSAAAASSAPLSVYFAVSSTGTIPYESASQFLWRDNLRYFRFDFDTPPTFERAVLLAREFALQLQGSVIVPFFDRDNTARPESSKYKAFILVPIGGRESEVVATYAINPDKRREWLSPESGIFSIVEKKFKSGQYAGPYPSRISEVRLEGELGLVVLNCTVNGGRLGTWNVANKAFIFVERSKDVYTHPAFNLAVDALTDALIVSNPTPGRYNHRAIAMIKITPGRDGGAREVMVGSLVVGAPVPAALSVDSGAVAGAASGAKDAPGLWNLFGLFGAPASAPAASKDEVNDCLLSRRAGATLTFSMMDPASGGMFLVADVSIATEDKTAEGLALIGLDRVEMVPVPVVAAVGSAPAGVSTAAGGAGASGVAQPHVPGGHTAVTIYTGVLASGVARAGRGGRERAGAEGGVELKPIASAPGPEGR